MKNKDNRPEAVLDRVLEKAGVMPPKTNEETVKLFGNELAMHLKPSNEAMKAVRFAKEELTTFLTEKDKQKEEAVAEERNRIEQYLYDKSHAGYTQEGEEYERYVHWCYVKETLTSPTKDKTVYL